MNNKNEIFNICSNNYNYILKINTYYNSTNEFGIYSIQFNFYSIDGGSIDFTIENDYNKFISRNYARINNITACGNNDIASLLQNNDATINMIYTAITCVVDMCPWITTFKFHDYHRQDCRKGEATPGMLLACYSIALTGKSWYESYLGATLENINCFNKYNDNIHLFNNPLESKCDWYDFNSYLYQFNLQKSINFDIIESTYKSSNSYAEFFNSLKTQITDMFELCNTLKNWIEMFMRLFIFETNLNLLDNTWTFNVTNIPKRIKYTISNYNPEQFLCSTNPNGYIIL